MKFSILLDSKLELKQWQVDALELVFTNGHELQGIYLCQNTKKPKKKIKNFMYFILAIFTRVNMKSLKVINISDMEPYKSVPKVSFIANGSNIWQEIPQATVNINTSGDLLVRFGMNLIKNPDALNLKHGIISFHHGDPTKYRGRPAGFYEVKNREPISGIAVQQISNKLDGGVILAKGFTRVHLHSYRKTLVQLYESGSLLLEKAFNSLEDNTPYHDQNSDGCVYKLPTNTDVIKFSRQMVFYFARRMFLSIFTGKYWRIGLVEEENLEASEMKSTLLEQIDSPKGALITADPFFDFEGNVFAEVIRRGKPEGEIFTFQDGTWHKVDTPFDCHASYPQTVQIGDSSYIFPEIAQKFPPTLFHFEDMQLRVFRSIKIKGIQNPRLIDATLYHQDDVWYLFCNLRNRSRAELYLFLSKSLELEFEAHRMSPIVIDPRAGRMGGSIYEKNTRLFRYAQDGSGEYGDGIYEFEIEELSPLVYRERKVKNYKFKDAKGPHTISHRNGKVLLDYYQTRISIFHVILRVKEIIKRNSPMRS